ncbi:MAG: tetratricopeptide repeat protein [Acidobacteriota bacterium]
MRHLAECGVATALLFPAIVSTHQDRSPTFTRDIAPIIVEHCAGCHRPGAGPFSLLTYDDVRGRARLIAEVTARRYMPPWKPRADVGGPFSGTRRLTESAVRVIAQWADSGAPEGDPADLTSAPPSTAGFRLGTPDLIVTLPVAYTLAADGPDEFRNFVIAIPGDAERFVSGLEFQLNGAPVVHHANLRLDSTSSSRDLDDADPRPGYEGAVGVNARYPDGHILGWTPGQVPLRVQPGLAWRLAPGADLVLQLHLRKSGKVETVRPRVAFYFTEERPQRLPLALRIGRQNLDLAPGELFISRDRYQLPVDVELISVHPHAHYRATDVKAYADLPDGSRRWLLHIDDWDFNWQDIYRFREPLALPRGTTLNSEFTYDNSAANPRNPDRPPRRVIFGQQSGDEMGDLWLQVLPRTARDRETLYADVHPRTLAEDVVGYEMLLRANPGHAGYRSDLALLHARLGRPRDAIAQFEVAVRLNPAFAPAQYNLATLLAAEGRLHEAAGTFRRALEARPDHAETHNNLGVVLKALGALEEAITHFRRAVALDPRNEAARTNLAAAVALKR